MIKNKPVLWEIANPGEGTYYIEHEPRDGDYCVERFYSEDYVLFLLSELEASRKQFSQLVKNSPEVALPKPACVYADHSYPAYSRKQVEGILESLGVGIKEEVA